MPGWLVYVFLARTMRTHRAALVSERALHCEAARIDCDDVKLRESTEYFPILLTRDYPCKNCDYIKRSWLYNENKECHVVPIQPIMSQFINTLFYIIQILTALRGMVEI